MVKIRELRENFSLTQKQLGEKIGIDGHNIGDWERLKCEPSTDMLIKLADFFGVSVDYLIGREDDFGNVLISANEKVLSEEEKSLLSHFSKLSPFERQTILKQIKALSSEIK